MLSFLLTLAACGNGEGNGSGTSPTLPLSTPVPQTAPTTDVETATPPPSPTSTPSDTYSGGVITEPLHPCGPSEMRYIGELQEHFLHWTQDGSRLVFDADDAIWVVDLERGDVRQVADVDHNYQRVADSPGSGARFLYGFHADVSPDGSSIVYSTCEYQYGRVVESWEGVRRAADGPGESPLEAYEIGVVNVDGNERKRLTRATGLVNHPSWSPDGEQIAFVAYMGWRYGDRSLEPYHYPDYYHEIQEHVKVALIAADGSSPPDGPLRQIESTGRVALYPPVWSPDGQRLAYLAHEGEEYPFDIVLYTVGLDGSDSTRIGRASVPAAWSPNGEELAFASLDGEAPVINAIRLDGTRLRTIWRGEPGNDATSISQVSWSPDGTELLFVDGAVYIVRPDGGGRSCLVPGRTAIRAAWSPDGSRIAVRHLGGEIITSPDGSRIAVRHSGNEIIMMSRDGTALRTLAIGEDDGRLHLSDLPPQTTGEAGCP